MASKKSSAQTRVINKDKRKPKQAVAPLADTVLANPDLYAPQPQPSTPQPNAPGNQYGIPPDVLAALGGTPYQTGNSAQDAANALISSNDIWGMNDSVDLGNGLRKSTLGGAAANDVYARLPAAMGMMESMGIDQGILDMFSNHTPISLQNAPQFAQDEFVGQGRQNLISKLDAERTRIQSFTNPELGLRPEASTEERNATISGLVNAWGLDNGLGENANQLLNAGEVGGQLKGYKVTGYPKKQSFDWVSAILDPLDIRHGMKNPTPTFDSDRMIEGITHGDESITGSRGPQEVLGSPY